MFSYVLFDLDGTLTDPREGITKSVQYALHKMSIDEPDITALEHFIGPPLREEFARSYGMDESAAELATAYYRERFSVSGWQENMLFDGVPALLSKLKENGKRLAIASSKPTVFIEKILHLFEIDVYFDVVSGATLDGTIGKKAQVVQNALEQLGVTDLSSAVLVGDRFHDVEGAAQNGISCIGVTFGFGGREELEQAGAARVVDTMSELQEVLLEK
ncbi:HAD hydrolase-like protein [Butyricicoccus sp. Marseille-Q5471]|uniref:HAD hydrolase-like protein n=1 Tax=Butyricicoccus sp. Marseille-Q5471 TaxID=3039493 RepID=UPI0024BCA397|nr:HAD hydrolase-like protein [Butyricicoccus sp. Marseille-Q5471]